MSSAAPYLQRAPRYVFRPDDESLMRFADMENQKEVAKQISRARVHDLSSTGISFVIASDQAPGIGDPLKIEFGLPGERQVAWFAIVVRVEERTEWDPELGDRRFTLVGLRFRQLPRPFTSAIERSLNRQLKGEEGGSTLLESGPETARERRLCGFFAFALTISFALASLPVETLVKIIGAL